MLAAGLAKLCSQDGLEYARRNVGMVRKSSPGGWKIVPRRVRKSLLETSRRLLGPKLAPCWPKLGRSWPSCRRIWPEIGPSWPMLAEVGPNLAPSWP